MVATEPQIAGHVQGGRSRLAWRAAYSLEHFESNIASTLGGVRV